MIGTGNLVTATVATSRGAALHPRAAPRIRLGADLPFYVLVVLSGRRARFFTARRPTTRSMQGCSGDGAATREAVAMQAAAVTAVSATRAIFS
jgi:hypothetical protein